MVACHRSPGKAEQQLIAIDSLISSTPDSALALLRAIDTASLPAGEPRAYHALLTCHAMWKAYVAASSDTLIRRAWQYYEHNGNYNRRIRAMLYMGTTAEELDHLEDAMRWYKRTELAANPDDHYHRGYALMSMANLYQNVSLSQRDAKNSYINAINEFSNDVFIDTTNYLFCLSQLGVVYGSINNDSSILILNKALKLSREYLDTTFVNENLISLAGYYYKVKRYDNAIKLSYEAIRSNKLEYKQLLVACYIAALSYTNINELDSALHYYNILPKPQNIYDSAAVIEVMAKIEYLKCNINHSIMLEKLSDSIIATQLYTAHKTSLKAIEQQEINIYNKKSSKRNQSYIHLLYICGLILISVIIYLIYQRILNKKKLSELNDSYNAIIANLISLTNNSTNKQEAYYNQQSSLRNFFDVIMYAAPRRSSSFRPDTHKVTITEEQWEQLCTSVNIMLDGFVNDLSTRYGCTTNEKRLFCICYCGASNNIVELCLPYKKQTIANMKQQIAHKVLGDNFTWNDLIISISRPKVFTQK